MGTFPIYHDVAHGLIATTGAKMQHYGDLYARDAMSVIQSASPVLIACPMVADYMEHAGPMAESLATIPSIPPFDVAWVESPTDDRGDVNEFNRIGVLVFRDPAVRSRWWFYTFLYTPRVRRAIPALYAVGVTYREDGTHDIHVPCLSRMHDDDGVSDSAKSASADFAMDGALLASAAFMFCHCKNVDLVERLPKRHEQREAKRRGEPILKYHEIVIDPNRSHATNETTRSPKTAPSVSLHLVRGHFAHYTDDKPLFGKYTGTFWVPAHVRGSADVGTVKSTYRVKALAGY